MESCEIDIKLEGRDVSRRVRIPGAALLGDLHVVIQAAMGWQETQFHAYEIDGDIVGDTMDEELVDQHPDVEDQDEFAIDEIFTDPPRKVAYLYGAWRHTLTLHAMVDAKEDTPVCVAGKGACPADGEDDAKELPFTVEEANQRISDAFLTITHYDAAVDQDARIWQEVDLDDMLSFVITYLEERHSGMDAPSRVLGAKLQVLVEAMLADGDSPELVAALQRLRDGGLSRVDAIEALVALMTETPDVLDDDADDAFDEFLVACTTYDVAAFKKRYPGSAVEVVTALAKKAADQDRNKRKRQRK